jgi:hypothetical protein
MNRNTKQHVRNSYTRTEAKKKKRVVRAERAGADIG